MDTREITPDELDGEIMRIISEAAEELNDEIAEGLEAIGNEAAAELEATSPKDTGKYSRSWRVSVKKDRGGSSVTVHNKEYQLTHLLENGTLNADGTQRTAPQPHIGRANENAQRKALRLLGGDENGA